MAKARAHQASLFRCAEMAGYSAVSMLDEDDADAETRREGRIARAWRAAVAVVHEWTDRAASVRAL
jgi:hypothetical protein